MPLTFTHKTTLSRSPQAQSKGARGLLFIAWTLITLWFTPKAYAQQEELEYQLELGGGIGLNQNFTDVKDQLGIAGTLVARFPLNPRMAVKTEFSYNTVKGNTSARKEFYPVSSNAIGTERLNYAVSSGIYDLSALYELHFLPYGYQRDYRKHQRLVPYIQMGLGLTYGAAGKAFTVNIPLGVGVKYKVAPRLNLGLDWLVHFSMSDKLDGLDSPLGIKSELFRNKDHFSALKLTLTYDLHPKCPTCNRD